MISACKGTTYKPSKRPTTDPSADNNPMLRDGVTGDWYAPRRTQP